MFEMERGANNERGVFEINEDVGAKEKRNAAGNAISLVDDLLTLRTEDFILFIWTTGQGAWRESVWGEMDRFIYVWELLKPQTNFATAGVISLALIRFRAGLGVRIIT